jgi:hypothetical protein
MIKIIHFIQLNFILGLNASIHKTLRYIIENHKNSSCFLIMSHFIKYCPFILKDKLINNFMLFYICLNILPENYFSKNYSQFTSNF